MYKHAPEAYICPICLGIEGVENDKTLLRQSDLVYKNELVTAFVNSFFISGNEGHVIVVPNKHFENLYDFPAEYAHAITDTSQKIALALKKAYNCDGITILQNNEPAGNQHAFHYHLHVFPRYTNDQLYAHMMEKRTTTPQERIPFVAKIKQVLQ